jgi:hypothetical protein
MTEQDYWNTTCDMIIEWTQDMPLDTLSTLVKRIQYEMLQKLQQEEDR